MADAGPAPSGGIPPGPGAGPGTTLAAPLLLALLVGPVPAAALFLLQCFGVCACRKAVRDASVPPDVLDPEEDLD